MLTDGPGYNQYDPNEVLWRIAIHGICINTIAGNIVQLTLPANCRRLQILASVGATFRISQIDTMAATGFALVAPGLWIEVPPLCEEIQVIGANNEVVYITSLCGDKAR